jgi:hypothetical protein
MHRIDDNTVALTQEELDNIREFIDSSLDHEWDRYTDIFICTDKWEDGKRSMNPEMYDMSQQMLLI